MSTTWTLVPDDQIASRFPEHPGLPEGRRLIHVAYPGGEYLLPVAASAVDDPDWPEFQDRVIADCTRRVIEARGGATL